ncbi:MAG: acyltransferase [Tannerellaceae bacterium]|jgi:acetyltransferase-like isoleucine patch superfamily enzyme|nr:acyltransferase [Tannerellaceae bacterium]
MKQLIGFLKKHVIWSAEKYARHSGVKIGKDCRIYTVRFGSEPFLISIGNHCTITSGVTFITHDGSTWLHRDEKGRRYYYAPIEIGNDVFIGANTLILPGIKIEDNVIVGAGSILTKSVPSGVIVAGNPAKIIGSYDELKRKRLETFISDKEMDKSIIYKERILKVVQGFKPFMKK